MTEEDKLAAKLRGMNCIIKFTDGEELPFFIKDLEISDSRSNECMAAIEKFINGNLADPDTEYFPSTSIAIRHDKIKYVIKI